MILQSKLSISSIIILQNTQILVWLRTDTAIRIIKVNVEQMLMFTYSYSKSTSFYFVDNHASNFTDFSEQSCGTISFTGANPLTTYTTDWELATSQYYNITVSSLVMGIKLWYRQSLTQVIQHLAHLIHVS